MLKVLLPAARLNRFCTPIQLTVTNFCTSDAINVPVPAIIPVIVPTARTFYFISAAFP